MQSIRTRYHGPANAHGSRISAACEAGRIYLPYNHALNLDENHAAAAQAMLDKLQWTAEYCGGCFDGDYYWSPVIRESAWSTVIRKSEAA